MEIRIYFECLEQAEYYLNPVITRQVQMIDDTIVVRLVRIKSAAQFFSKLLAPILFWKVSDALITIVYDSIE